jgi:ATP-dependent Clp protease adaptor protein ClpS
MSSPGIGGGSDRPVAKDECPNPRDSMTDDANSAVATPPAQQTAPMKQRKTRLADAKPQKQPPYAVVLFNDELHTFRYVIDTLCKVFGYPLEKSFALTLQIHNEGKGIVWSGTRELAELKRDQIRSAGPDFYALAKVDFPLRATIEPLPG